MLKVIPEELHVYKLIDPRDSLPFYVGCTTDLEVRYQQHLMGDKSNLAKSERIAELLQLGLFPIMEEIETIIGTLSDAKQRESYWTRCLRSEGVVLVNTGYLPKSLERTKHGYALRDDLVKDLKRIALEEDRTLYEVMEEAMEEYLQRYKNCTPR